MKLLLYGHLFGSLGALLILTAQSFLFIRTLKSNQEKTESVISLMFSREDEGGIVVGFWNNTFDRRGIIRNYPWNNQLLHLLLRYLSHQQEESG
jgi:hypothetical protein